MPIRRRALVQAAAGALIVTASYLFLMVTKPGVASYLGHATVVVLWLVPFALTGVLWRLVPRESSKAEAALAFASTLLLVAAIGMSLWRIAYSNQWGGDMQALFVFVESLAMSIGVLLTWCVGYVALRVLER